MAQAFEFRLETVRRLRKQDVDRQRRSLAEAIARMDVATRRLTELTDEWDTFVDHSRVQRSRPTLDAASLRNDQMYLGQLKSRIAAARAEADRQTVLLTQERERLGECSKRLKVIEKLRERQWQRFRREAARRERVEADEMSTQRFIRGEWHGGSVVEIGE